MPTTAITPPSIVFWRNDQTRWGAQQTEEAQPFEFESAERENVVREAFNNAYINSPAFRQLVDSVVAQEGVIRIGQGRNSAVHKQTELGIDAYLLIDIDSFDLSLMSTNDFNFHKDGSVRPTHLITVMAHEFAHLIGKGHPVGMNNGEAPYTSGDLNAAAYDYAGSAVEEEWRVDKDMGLSSRTQYGLPISPSSIGTGPGQFEIGRSFSEGKPIDIVRIAGVPDFGDIDISARTDDKVLLAFAHESGSKITGGKGNDFIYGNKGADRLYGREGNDYLIGQGGHDLLDGGEGDDRLVLTGSQGGTVRGGTGSDQIDLRGSHVSIDKSLYYVVDVNYAIGDGIDTILIDYGAERETVSFDNAHGRDFTGWMNSVYINLPDVSRSNFRLTWETTTVSSERANFSSYGAFDAADGVEVHLIRGDLSLQIQNSGAWQTAIIVKDILGTKMFSERSGDDPGGDIVNIFSLPKVVLSDISLSASSYKDVDHFTNEMLVDIFVDGHKVRPRDFFANHSRPEESDTFNAFGLDYETLYVHRDHHLMLPEVVNY